MIRDHRLTRRSTLKLAGTGALAAAATHNSLFLALAQDATPTTGNMGGEALAAMGLPELNITVTDMGYEGLESQLDAGMYLVHATFTGSQGGNLSFMQLPDGITANDLLSMLGGGDAGESGGEMASPVAEGGEEGGGAPPEWFYTVYMPGGVAVDAGQSAHFIIDLRPGNYIVWGEDPMAAQTPIDLTVSGGSATPLAEPGILPQADITITELGTEDGYVFEYDGEFGVGSQVIEVVNDSDQPHFVEFDLLPEGTTREDVDALIESFMTGAPVEGGLSESDVQPVYFVGTQSTNTTQWHEVALEPGTYLVSCWIPDYARGGIPHAMEGMYDVVTIGGAMATPTS